MQLNGDVFYTCAELEELVPGKFRSLKKLNSNTFLGCNKLKSLDFTGSTITFIEYNSVKWLYGMEHLVLPETLTYMEDWSFEIIIRVKRGGNALRR